MTDTNTTESEMTVTEFIAKKVEAGKLSPETAAEINRLIYKEFITKNKPRGK